MVEIEKLRTRLPEPARDVKLNLQSVLQQSSLTPAQLWGTAVASAIASRNPELARAVLADARGAVDEQARRRCRRGTGRCSVAS